MTESTPPPEPLNTPTPRRPLPRRLSPGDWLLMVSVSALLSALTIILIAVFILPANVSLEMPPGGGPPVIVFKPPPPSEKVLLVMGVDTNRRADASAADAPFDGARSDTMMMVRVSPANHTVSVVSIPRDSKVYLAGRRGIDKINAAHAYGGPELTVDTVEDAFGIPVDNYVVADYHGLRDLVDAIGGVDIYIEKPLHYRDKTAKLNINLDTGYQTLDGVEAEGFLRFRHDELGDIGRIRRQQYFVSALSQKMKDPFIYAKLPSLIQVVFDHVRTDLSADELLRLAMFMKDIRAENLRVATLPGHPGSGRVSYWIIDANAAQRMLDRLILDNASSSPVAQKDDSPIRVGILHTPARAEEATTLQSALGQAGFAADCITTRTDVRTQIIEHSRRVNDQTSNQIRKVVPFLKDARLIFAPVGTTFEANTCRGDADYTVTIGNDV